MRETAASGAGQEGPSALLTNRAATPSFVRAAAVAVFLAAAAAATLAQQMDRPVTAALAFLLGVTLVGALTGLRGGLLAAILASVIYNVFLSDPVFRFSLSSAEDYVPLIAFNLSAAASGLLAGRLKDRALAAELSNRRIRALLEVSQRLQAAVELEDIPTAIAGFTGSDSASQAEIFIASGADLIALQQPSHQAELAQQLLASGEPSLRRGDHKAFALSTPAGARAVLVIRWLAAADRGPEQHDLEAFLNLLSITLERCLLLEQLSEAQLVKRSEEFKTALLSSVSHDMRTPLSAISASASSLTRFGTELDQDMRRDLLNTIQEQCDRLNRYTTNLLNLGRIQAGVDQSQFTECDALEVLGAAISRTRSLGSSHRITKRYDVSAAPVRADPVMLEQVFYNVLENAVRYSPEDSPIAVSARWIDGDVVISISDAGEGILAGDLELVFDRFYRSRSSVHHEGSGLGLSIAKGFTEAFGGSVEAEREDERQGGTTIRIRLPLQSTTEAFT